MVGGLIPFDVELTAKELHVHLALGIASQYGGDHGRARPRAAGKGFARAALSNPHLQMMPADDLHELGVRAPGKQGMMLKLRPDTG